MYKNLKKKSPAKRIDPAPRACQPIAITTTPSLYCAEGLTGLYLLGAYENINFQNSISRNKWGSGSCHSGITSITHSYRTFGIASFVQKAQGRLTHSPCKLAPLSSILMSSSSTICHLVCSLLKKTVRNMVGTG